jgi:hypothetical protein
MSRTEVQAFFEAYRDAFNRLDGDAVAALWHTPSAITNTRSGEASAQLTLWSADAPMRANHRALCDLYRGNGYRDARFEIVDCINLGAHHAFANVHWSLWRHDGSLLQEFRTGYNLLRTAEGPKVLLVTQYEEDIARMKQHAAQ